VERPQQSVDVVGDAGGDGTSLAGIIRSHAADRILYSVSVNQTGIGSP